jgi:hypothetical protein
MPGTANKKTDGPATFHLEIEHKLDYLHIRVSGINTIENVSAYLEKVVEECVKRKCHKVLIEEHLEGPRLGLAEIAEVASESSRSAVGRIKALAFVDVNAEDDSMEFAELVARNRSMPVRVFRSLAEAEAWIKIQVSGQQVH